MFKLVVLSALLAVVAAKPGQLLGGAGFGFAAPAALAYAAPAPVAFAAPAPLHYSRSGYEIVERRPVVASYAAPVAHAFAAPIAAPIAYAAPIAHATFAAPIARAAYAAPIAHGFGGLGYSSGHLGLGLGRAGHSQYGLGF